MDHDPSMGMLPAYYWLFMGQPRESKVIYVLVSRHGYHPSILQAGRKHRSSLPEGGGVSQFQLHIRGMYVLPP